MRRTQRETFTDQSEANSGPGDNGLLRLRAWCALIGVKTVPNKGGRGGGVSVNRRGCGRGGGM